jgi:hypothetical protein
MLNTPKFLSGRAGICKRFVNLTKIQTVRSLCQKSGLCFRRHLKVDRSLFLAGLNLRLSTFFQWWQAGQRDERTLCENIGDEIKSASRSASKTHRRGVKWS